MNRDLDTASMTENELLDQLALSFASEDDREIFSREPFVPDFYLYETLPTHVSGWIGLNDIYWIRHFGQPKPFFYRGTKIFREPHADRPVEIRRRNSITGFAQFPDRDTFTQRMIEDSARQNRTALEEHCRADVEDHGERGTGGPIFLHILFTQ